MQETLESDCCEVGKINHRQKKNHGSIVWNCTYAVLSVLKFPEGCELKNEPNVGGIPAICS